MTEIRTYHRRPESVEATLWNGTASDATRVIDWVLANGGTARFIEGQFPYDDGEKGCPFSAPSLAVNTPQCGTSFANAGDYIVKTNDDVFDVATSFDFRAEYKAARP